MVRDQLPADIDSKHVLEAGNDIGRLDISPLYGIPNNRSRDEGYNMREAETRVYDQHAIWGRRRIAAGSFVWCSEQRAMRDQRCSCFTREVNQK